MNKIDFLHKITNFSLKSLEKTISLLDDGATIPFISRYRKEFTGGLDEVEVSKIRNEAKKFDDILTRKETIINSISEQGKLTSSLKDTIANSFDLHELEDIYLPFKQKRLTRGEKAKKLGLESLAKIIMSQRNDDVYYSADRFVKGEVKTAEDAISGALDIIAEWINENVNLRQRLRQSFKTHSTLTSKLVKGKDALAEKYKDYFDHSERLDRCASHRFLAIYRASKEGFLRLKSSPDKEYSLNTINRFFVKGNSDSSKLVEKACKDAYQRLLYPSLETEALNEKKKQADLDAISVFSKNLRQLLLAPPLGEKRILAIDPGFKSGCKIVCLDENGQLLTNITIYPHPPQNETSKAKNKIAQMVQSYKIEAIAIGNGTAGRETEFIVKSLRFDREVQVFSVNEDGASVYSASTIARKEFPDYDVTVRGAISIGRRLMDPLAELVKIDPKSVGVGQYQHEVDQNNLKIALEDVVVSCVNNVGVDLNTASPYLLQHVSGLGIGLAENIVAYRKEIGRFTNRNQIKEVKRLGSKAFEQAAGFLRITDGENPLDNTSVHPERYKVVNAMASKSGLKTENLIGNNTVLNSLKAEDLGLNSITFTDLIGELKKPTRDPRKKVKVLEFDKNIRKISDLEIGMSLNGIVTNVTNFGAFVDIGIKENGLIHKSQLANVYVEDPADFISLNEHVSVRVVTLDVDRKRIGLKKN